MVDNFKGTLEDAGQKDDSNSIEKFKTEITEKLKEYFTSKCKKLEDDYKEYEEKLNNCIEDNNEAKIKVSDLLKLIYGRTRKSLYDAVCEYNSKLNKICCFQK